MSKIVLASSSKYRAQLLDKIKLSYLKKAPDTNESPQAGETPAALVERLSLAKAKALQEQYPMHLIIGSDQVADFNGKIIGKPGNHQAATEQLSILSGQTVNFRTGLCLYNSATGEFQSEVVNTQVRYRGLTPEEIENYLRMEQPYDCAGSFKSEALGISILDSITGDDPNALVGLPLISLLKMLRKEGINPLASQTI